MNHFFQILISVVLASGLMGCTSLTKLFMTEKKCKAINTFEYGKKTALQQMSQDTFVLHKKICEEKHQINLSQAEFDKGYAQGIKELCTYEGGYRFGLQGLTDKKICPKKKRPSFLKGYTQGRIKYLEHEISTMYYSCNSCCDPCDTCICGN